MFQRFVLLFLTVGLLSSNAQAKNWDTFEVWQDYLSRHRTECFPPFAKLRKKPKLKIGKSVYRLEGTKLVEVKPRRRAQTRVGVISAPKDGTRLTLSNIENFVAAFKAKKVHWIVANGDLAYDSKGLPAVLEILGKSGVPVFVSIGNGESVAPFNDHVLAAMEKYSNLFNANFIRLVEGAGVTMLTMPGYYDPAYIHPEDGCKYTRKDLQKLSLLARASKSKKLLLVSHGPPKGQGKNSLDVIHDGTNVGDGMLNTMMANDKISFGIFGHILESGGRGVNAQNEAVKPGVKSPSLMVNVGSASAIPWKMLDGSSAEGMAMVVTVGRAGASYEVLTAAKAVAVKRKAGVK
jgi:Icc-related predicted phosphoesterase